MAAAHHTIEVYGVELYLVTTRRDWSALRRRLPFIEDGPNVDSLGSCHMGVLYPDAGLPVPHVILWLDLKRIPNNLDLVETCAHEASHAAGQILEYIGHDYRGIDEPHAYLTGWITRWAYDEVNPVEVRL